MTRSRDFHEIEPLLPYSWPWVLIDKVLDWVPGERITCLKAVSASDPIVAAHFRQARRLMPGVVLIEFVAQSAYLLHQLSAPTPSSEPEHVLAKCQASFLAPAEVGSVLVAEVKLRDMIQGTAVYEAQVACGDKVVCRVQLISAARSRMEGQSS